MAKYAFLSKEWMEEARKIREEYKGKAQPIPHAIKMNLNITDVPHVDGVFQAHMDSSSGEVEMEEGHMDSPELTVTLGMMDLQRRKLVDDPRGRLERAGYDLKVLSTAE